MNRTDALELLSLHANDLPTGTARPKNGGKVNVVVQV